jgi:hypothetical protein
VPSCSSRGGCLFVLAAALPTLLAFSLDLPWFAVDSASPLVDRGRRPSVVDTSSGEIGVTLKVCILDRQEEKREQFGRSQRGIGACCCAWQLIGRSKRVKIFVCGSYRGWIQNDHGRRQSMGV